MGFTDGFLGQFASQLPGVGGMFGTQPQLNPTALPATAAPLLNAQQAQGEMSTDDIKARNMQGTGQADQFQRSPEQTARMSAALGMDPNAPMSSAIGARAQHAYGANLAQLNTKQTMEAPETLAHQQNNAVHAQLGQQQFLNSQYEDRLGVYMNQQAARSKAIGSIFQMGGILGGHAVASNRGSAQKKPGESAQDGTERGGARDNGNYATSDSGSDSYGEYSYDGEYE